MTPPELLSEHYPSPSLSGKLSGADPISWCRDEHVTQATAVRAITRPSVEATGREELFYQPNSGARTRVWSSGFNLCEESQTIGRRTGSEVEKDRKQWKLSYPDSIWI